MAGVPWRRYRDFRHRQREALHASNHPHPERHAPDEPGPVEQLLGEEEQPREGGPPAEGGPQTVPFSSPEEAANAPNPFGRAGAPLNRHSPFYVGFVGALGALIAVGLWRAMGRLTTTLTILVVAFFLTLALNPLVEWLIGKDLRRSQAVAVVFAGVLVVFALLGLLVMPPVIREGAALLNNAPDYVDSILNSKVVRDLDKNYDIVDRLQKEINDRLTDGSFVSRVFGGVLGAGRLVVNVLFQAFTILVLTLYFLATFPRVKQAAFAMVPASRRARVTSLSEEIMRRTGAYAMGQAAVATVNAVLSYVMMTIVGIPYAAVLAVVVGFLGLIPMVGATLGALLVATVAFFDEPKKAIIAGVYYLIYQQLENYVVAPKIMARTVSVPGSVTVVAAMTGGTLLGVLGALLAVPIAAGLLLLYEEVLLPRQRRA
ncbi:MAG: AI-2E family transporter [Tetrasphaera sp.]